MITLPQLLKAAHDKQASDVHITVGAPPLLRVHGNMVRVKAEDLTLEDTKRLCFSVLSEDQKTIFEEHKELDFSFGVRDLARFRGNLFIQRGAVGGVFRQIPNNVPTFKDLGLPESMQNLVEIPNGLVLVTGPTGSGKSSTIAAMVDALNAAYPYHIMTLEDPIEFVHQHKNSIINQREIGSDTISFLRALRQVVRQDPDVVVMGELRDLESIEAALTIAETGHLVIATLHTNSAMQTINRIVTVFPAAHQDRIRVTLSFVLQAVVSQRLIQTVKPGRTAALEILIMNHSIRNLVRENKLHQVYSMMQLGQDKTGMTTLNQSLLNLILRRRISMKEAFLESSDVLELEDLMKKAGV